SKTKFFMRVRCSLLNTINVFTGCLATCGNGRAAPTRLTLVIALCPVRSVNTTANSCATNTFCAAVPAPRRAAISAPPIAISFSQKNAGSLQESGSHAIHNESVGRNPPGADLNAKMTGDSLTLSQQISAPESSDFLADLIAGLSGIPRMLPC